MTLITNAPRLPGDQPAAPLVAIELLDDSRNPVVGYVSGTGEAIHHRLAFAANGQHALSPTLSEWEIELVPNAQIEPAGTVYRITEQRGRAMAAIHIVEVPENGGPYTVLETLIDEPGSMGSLLLDHLADTIDAHDASAVSVLPAGTLIATDVQAALAELDAQDAAEAVARSAADTSEATARAAADATLTTNLSAEATARAAADTAEAAALAAHLADTADAHDASAVSVAAISGLAATDVQAALAEHQSDLTNEAAARAAADTTEAAARVAADSALAADIAALDGDVGTVDTALAAEAAARTAADAAEATARANADTAEATTRATADTAATSALAAHAADTTAIHGIADTTQLVLTNDARLSDARPPTDNSVTQAKVQAGSLGIDRLAVDPRARGTHTGTQEASSISDFTTAVRANRLDQMAAPAAAVNLNGQRMTNGVLPSASTDLITREYADALRSGLLLKADPVRVMVDSNVNINAPGSVLDSIALSVDDSVLLTGQTSANDNGIYLWKGAATSMVRRSDANTSEEMRSGAAVWVTAGTYDDQRWALVTVDPITLGVTNLTWAFDGGLAHVAAGAGLTKTGNTIDVGEGTGIEVTADAVGIADGGVDTDQLADDAVTAAKLADDSVDTAAILDLNVTTAKLADEAVTTGKLGDDAVTAAKLADNAVDTAAIADGAVALAKLGFDVATQVELEAAVTAINLALAAKLGVHWVTAPAVGETTTQQRTRIQAKIDEWGASGGVFAVEPALYQVDGPLYLPEDPPSNGSVFHSWMLWGFGARIQGMPTGTSWTPWFVIDDILPVARTYLGSPQTASARLVARAGRKFTILGIELSGPGSAPGTDLGTADSVTIVTATAGAAGPLTGTYRYQVTHIDANGNETPGGPFSLRVTAAGQAIDLTTIAPGPAGTTDRKLYRTKAIVQTTVGGGVQGQVNIHEQTYFLALISDNTTTTYTDTTADASLGAACPAIGGLRVYGSYQLLVDRCNFEFCNTDVDVIFGVQAETRDTQSYSPYNYGIRMRSAQDLVVGATHGSSAGNISVIRRPRIYGANNTLAHIDVIGTNEVHVVAPVTEGRTPENAIRFNRDQSTNTQRFKVTDWHPEFAGGPPRDAELKVFGGACRIVMQDVSFTTVNAVMVSVSESLGGASVEIDRITYIATGAKFDNGASAADWRIRGSGAAVGNIVWADVGFWVGGLRPTALAVERWSTSGAPDNMGGTYPTDVFSRYLLQSLNDIIIRTGTADPGIGLKVEGAIQSRVQNGILHPDSLGGAGVAGANYFTIKKDEALKQYRIWGKDSAGVVINAAIPYGADAGTGTAILNGYTGIVRRTAAPTDADLLASEAVPWFDSTPASPALVWKGKDSAGAVRTQRIELAGGPGAERYLSLGNFGAAPAVNIANGTVQQGTLNTNAVFAAFTAPPVATSYAWSFTLILRQDATGGRTATWNANVKWPGDTAPTLTVTANRADVVNFLTYDGGTTWYGSLAMANIP